MSKLVTIALILPVLFLSVAILLLFIIANKVLPYIKNVEKQTFYSDQDDLFYCIA
jgi:hypothetical protein